MVRVADYIAQYLVDKGIKHVFMVTGGGAMFLNDGIASNDKIQGVFNHHEQACAMAAVGYTKVTNKPAVVMPTTGCGGTNTITGLLDAWQDSNKVVFISGNVNKKEMSRYSDFSLRKFGVQEVDIVKIVKPLTKYAQVVANPEKIAYHLDKAFHICENGRPGPVWLDIPMDVQSAMIDPNNLRRYIEDSIEWDFSIDYVMQELYEAKRPIVLAGYGIHLSGARHQFKQFIDEYNLPFVTTYMGIDLYPESERFIGRLGTKGDRAGNFAVQNSDLVIVLGSSLSVPVTGFRYETFAREAKIIVVDIDNEEHRKGTVKINKFIHANVKDYLDKILAEGYLKCAPSDYDYFIKTHDWTNQCIRWKQKWPVLQKEHLDKTDGINMYHLMALVSDHLPSHATVISDAGSAYYVTSQALQLNSPDQQYVTSGAQAEMGFTLPACIGVAFADPKNKNIIGITGDGSLQMNIQELQTLKHYNLPVKLFVLNNGGYLSIRNTMDKFFNSRHMGTDANSGLSFPQLSKIAGAYDIEYIKLHKATDLNYMMDYIMKSRKPIIVEVMCPFKQEIVPSSAAKQDENGKLVSQPLENMYPFLSEEEFKQEMIIKPL